MKTKKTITLAIMATILAYVACNTLQTENTSEQFLDPFAANNGEYPPRDTFGGPYFVANYDYPSYIPERRYPWEGITKGGPLTKQNATEYIMAVREYIAEDMAMMINQPSEWLGSPNKQNWYNMGWSGQSYEGLGWEGLETVYGTMTGQVIKNDIFQDYGFNQPMQNHALVYYNDVSALTLNELWKSNSPSGFYPEYTTEAAQFDQNAIVIKAAGTTASARDWPVLEGAGTFPIYRETLFGPRKGEGNVLQELTWIQFDIIIKDTIASPETGWVFSTFIYDVDSPGQNTFDKLTLLGVVWGNDPGKMQGNEVLEETYRNPNAPAYANATIGYGGRLAGPIDVALVGGITDKGVADSVLVLNPYDGIEGSEMHLLFTASACMSCHGTASFPPQNDFYPSPDPTHALVFSDTLFNPASAGWSNFYQNRPGTEIMPNYSGYINSTMALDYDLFMQFALNNSLQSKHYNPEGIKKPEGYTFWDTHNHSAKKMRSPK